MWKLYRIYIYLYVNILIRFQNYSVYQFVLSVYRIWHNDSYILKSSWAYGDVNLLNTKFLNYKSLTGTQVLNKAPQNGPW